MLFIHLKNEGTKFQGLQLTGSGATFLEQEPDPRGEWERAGLLWQPQAGSWVSGLLGRRRRTQSPFQDLESHSPLGLTQTSPSRESPPFLTTARTFSLAALKLKPLHLRPLTVQVRRGAGLGASQQLPLPARPGQSRMHLLTL